MKSNSRRVFLLAMLTIVLAPAISIICNKLFYSNLPTPALQNIESENEIYYHLDLPEFGTLNTVSATKNSQTFKSSQTITPPIPGRNVPNEKHIIEAASGDKLITKNNSTIIIPPNAFLDANGNLVTGNVEIQYREISDPYQIFVSGLPMHYDSTGTELLESAGMIELNANVNGEAVYTNPNNLITIILNTAPPPGYNIYSFDNLNNAWKFESPAVKKIPVTNVVENKIVQMNVLPEYPEKPKFVKAAFYIQTKMSMKPYRKYFFGRKVIPQYFIFSILHNKNSFPELNELNKTSWVYDQKNVIDAYYLLFPNGNINGTKTGQFFADSLSIEKKDDQYTLKIVNRNEITNIKIRPYIQTEKDQQKFDSSFSSYTKALEKRYDVQKEIINKYNEELESYYIKSNSFRNEPNNYRNIFGDDYYGYQINNVSFAVSKFGIWNCDRGFTPDLPVKLAATFIDEAGKKVNVDQGWMLLKNRNTLLAVTDFSKFKFKPESENLFFTVFPNGRIGIVYPNEFKHHAADKATANFKIKVYDFKTDGEVALKKAMGIRDKTASLKSKGLQDLASNSAD